MSLIHSNLNDIRFRFTQCSAQLLGTLLVLLAIVSGSKQHVQLIDVQAGQVQLACYKTTPRILCRQIDYKLTNIDNVNVSKHTCLRK